MEGIEKTLGTHAVVGTHPAAAVSFDETNITYDSQQIAWADLSRVIIKTTTDWGPLVEDVCWLLCGGEDSGCIIPNGADGLVALIERLQQLPGFDNHELIEAMGCAQDAVFILWQKRHR